MKIKKENNEILQVILDSKVYKNAIQESLQIIKIKNKIK